MKIFESMQNFFESMVRYINSDNNLFFIFLGAFLLVSVVIIIITSFAYECQLTKTIDRINKFLERNPRINDDNLVAFNNLMKAGSVPKTLRKQWQQFMLYREHPASYYMSFKHCVENPMRNSAYRQEMTVYKVISYILIALSLVVSVFMEVGSSTPSVALQYILIIPLVLLVLYWLVSMVLDLVHNAISNDLFQNYQYFEINMDKAMITLPEFVDYEVLFSQDEIRRGIPVLYAYLQKRAIQEQQELEKARIKSVDHEKFDFDKAGLDGSLVLDRAMRETENFSSQRKKYMQEIERVNNEINVLENNYKEQVKEFQRQVQTSKETVENLKEQLEQATSTIEINYIKKQMRDEINRQQLSEKEFDILTDKHNQEIKALNQEIKHYEEETTKAKEALEIAMLSEFNTYSIKVYDNLEKIVDQKVQGKVDDYKEQIKGLEGQLEEKNEELENVYTRYQEALSQLPAEPVEQVEQITELPIKKGKKKKKNTPTDNSNSGMVQPEQLDEFAPQYVADEYAQYDDVQEYDQYQDDQSYDYNAQDYSYDDASYMPTDNAYDYDSQNYDAGEYVSGEDEQYASSEYDYAQDGDYIPLDNDYTQDINQDYIPLDQEYVPLDNNQEYVPLNEDYQMQEEYRYDANEDYSTPVNDGLINADYVEQTNKNEGIEGLDGETDDKFDDTDFDIDFNNKVQTSGNFDDMGFDFNINKEEPEAKKSARVITEKIEDEDFDINKVLGLYDSLDTKETVKAFEDIINDTEADIENSQDTMDDDIEMYDNEDELPAPSPVVRKAGRPRKVVDEAEVAPKRKPGRPRKVVDAEDIKPKRSVGRPKKLVEEVEQLDQPKRKAGRPRKDATIKSARQVGRPRKQQIDIVAKKKVGRPKKAETAQKRQVGRPKKDATVKSARNVGRPRKAVAETRVLEAPKRQVGRPKKVETAPKRQVGRPKKQDATILEKPKSKRGRPRKN